MSSLCCTRHRCIRSEGHNAWIDFLSGKQYLNVREPQKWSAVQYFYCQVTHIHYIKTWMPVKYVFLTSKRPLGNGPLSSWGRLYCELHSRRKVVLFFHIQEFVNRKTRLARLFHGLVWVHSGKCSTYPQSTQNKCPGEYDSQHFVFLGPSRWSYLAPIISDHCLVYSSGKVLSNKEEDKEMDEEREEELKEVPESVGTFLWSLLTSSKHGFIFQVSLSTHHKPDL